ncbi:hypothetical protein [uncultured Sunxiuqinia sp.]|uniref:hypothetical protein n=1 Tax=Sunxiuqinia rutila TaxID=1397841 RepID=UPI0026295624|nr:hypothetical protein [uncultured Sunxiuqinia sp.]
MGKRQDKVFKSDTGRVHRCSIVSLSPLKIENVIEYPELVKTPDKLIKFYAVSANSVDALLNNYLYAANPLLFNDPFDCPAQLWNLDSFRYENIQRFALFEDLIKKYGEDRFMSPIHNRNLFFEFRMATLGIICLHEFSLNSNDCQDTLWGYYSNQQGFAVKFDSCILRKSLGTPFQVEYLERSKLDEFSLDSIKENEDFLPMFLRWTTQKKKIWENEYEWRFVLQDLKAETLMLDSPGKVRRRTYYKSAISEVLLGLKFFHKTNMVEVSNSRSYYVIDTEKYNHQYKLLSFISFPSEIPVKHIYMKQKKLAMHPRSCQIFNENNGRFRIEYLE